MRIAVYHNLPSGGAKRALYEMTRRLVKDHDVDVFTLSVAEHDFCDLRPHCRQHVIFPFRPLPLARRPFGRINQGMRSADLLRLEALQRQVAAQIDGGRYDVVFAHNCQFSQSPGLLKFLRTTSVYYCQEPPRLIYEPPVERPSNDYSQVQRLGNMFDPFPGLYRRTLCRLDRDNVQAAGTVLVNSHYSRETIYRTYGIFARVGYLGVDTDMFHSLAMAKEDFVLSVGAINPRKGFDFLIESLARIPETKRPRLVTVCNSIDPTEMDYLETLAQRLGVLFEIKAMIDDANLIRLYNQAQLVLYAPVMEPFGFVPLEAMACGTPVIGIREGGVRESILEGITGVLVERDTMLFAAAVESLLDNSSLRTELSNNGVAYARANWTWDKSVAWIEGALCRAIEGRQS